MNEDKYIIYIFYRDSENQFQFSQEELDHFMELLNDDKITYVEFRRLDTHYYYNKHWITKVEVQDY